MLSAGVQSFYFWLTLIVNFLDVSSILRLQLTISKWKIFRLQFFAKSSMRSAAPREHFFTVTDDVVAYHHLSVLIDAEHIGMYIFSVIHRSPKGNFGNFRLEDQPSYL